MAARGEFFEWAEVHGNLYGTSRTAIEERLAQRRGRGAGNRLAGRAADQAHLCPCGADLHPAAQLGRTGQRLNRRGEDRPEVIAQRMANARTEVAQARHFDFVIINALFETALFDLKTVVHSQRLKYAAQMRNRSQVFAALGLV
jgi:guanylate kinase